MDNTVNDNIEGTIDLIIPTYKPDHKFDELMERMKRQTVQPNHIFVINTESEYFDEEKYKDVPNLTVIHIKRDEFDHGGTRNYGASLSNAEYIMFMTQDAVPANSNLVEEILNGFKNEEIAAVYGKQLARKNASTIEKFTRTFNYPSKDSLKNIHDLPCLGIKTYFCSNVCAAYRKSVYDKLGGFVTKTIFNEDMIMAGNMVQAGYSIYYAAKGQVIHSHKYSYMEQLRRNFDLAVSQRQYKELFGRLKSEGEGIQLVKDTMAHLVGIRKAYLIPDLIMQSGFKYLGYRLGLNYEHLPKRIVRYLSMNRGYWKDTV